MKVSQLDKPGLISTQIIDRQPLTLAAESTVADALVAMAQSGKNYVLILAAQTLVGILTERDVLRMVAQTQTWTNRRLKEVMTRSLVTYPAVSKPDVFEALKLLRQHQIRHLPVVDAKQQLTGLITYETLQSTLQPTALLRLRTVREVMNTAVLCATSNDSLLAIAAQMYTHKASCVVILESTAAATRCPVGIITERDIVQLQALGTDFAATPAHTAMSYPLLPIQAQDTLWQAHQAMTQHRVRRLVVRTDSDGLAGLITQTELLRSLDPLELYQNLQALETLVQQQTQSLNQLNTHLQQKVDAYQTLKQELEQANQELEQRVAERTAELEAANLLLCQQIQTLNPAVSPAQQPKLLSAAWIKFCLKEIPLPLPLATWLDRHPIYLGAGLTATTICLIEGLRQAGVMVPAPFLLIMVTAILTASTNGLWAGLASTGVWAIYVIWAALFSVGPPALSGGVAPVSLGILMVLLAGLRQGIERDRYQALNQLLISTNQSLDRQIQRHTATLQKTNQQLRQEVLERQQVETALRESETRFRVTFEKAAVGIVNTSPQGYFLKVNQKFCEILGYTAAELIDRHFQEFTCQADQPRGLQMLESMTTGQKIQGTLEKRYVRKDGTLVWANLTIAAVHKPNGQLDYQAVIVEDISDRKEAEIQQQNLIAILEATTDLVGMASVEGQTLYVNKAGRKLSGAGEFEDLSHINITDMHPDWALQKVQQEGLPTAIQTGHWQGETAILTRTGEEIPVSQVLTAHRDSQGRLQFFSTIMRDLSETYRAERARREAETKAVLLKEIHHRVKNNLQIVSGILYLQSRTLDQPQALKSLQDCRDRVEAMALIHEKFYGSASLEAISFNSYIRSLTQNLLTSYSVGKQIELKTEIEPVSFNIDTAIPCGLIINELVANALQHAFLESSQGEIIVKFSIQAEKDYELIVQDNGVGFPATIDFQTQTSMGLRLVRTLAVNQLRGTVEIKYQNGTLFCIRFPIDGKVKITA